MKIDPIDKIFSDYIKKKAGGKCEFCGQRPSLMGYHTHHFVGRRYLNTRWEEDNCVALCLHCHNLMHDFSTIEQDFFMKRIGTKRMEELEILARTYHKMGKGRREEIKLYYQEKLGVQ